ncbi:unnamed protein product [Cyclocybe aegerita]|uniref:holo-[acyl-carrier-protein] synthase n=1 Tax=Cyclocybe aegerita TaxID=1973307 RepID=A0A8S0WEB9_CYCAE|nr:unnamed protein product [Cyclocybe aegerita]
MAYNITHDNNLIAMAFGPGLQNPPAFSIGIDVMKVRIPGRESLESFITTMGEQVGPSRHLWDKSLIHVQLTQREHSQLRSTVPDSERIKVFFWMWTLKEAYTKALGLGLGFDFKRVEFDMSNRVVRIDGAEPMGWRFRMFTLMDGEDLYEGVIAEYLGGGTHTEVIVETEQPNWLKIYSAVTFTENAIETLKAE